MSDSHAKKMKKNEQWERRRTGAVDHDGRVELGARLLNRGSCCFDVFGCKVGTSGASTKDDMHVLQN